MKIVNNRESIKQEHLKEMGKRMKYLREELHLNQKEFAAELDISASLISQIEMGHKNPSFDCLIRLMNHYQVSFDWLFYGIGEKFTKKKTVESEPEKYIDEIISISDMVWFLENSNLFKLNVMGYSAKFLLENEEHIKKELSRRRQKNKEQNKK
jgi:transcriptional regulator with XRE-family HTH domain